MTTSDGDGQKTHDQGDDDTGERARSPTVSSGEGGGVPGGPGSGGPGSGGPGSGGPGSFGPSSGEARRRYVDLGRVGLGGFSEVRKVRDLHVEREVARKVQLPAKSGTDDDARFREEIRITALLRHPGVVPLYDWGTLDDGRCWFTMKLVRGETISKHIEQLHALEGAEFVLRLRRLLDEFRRLCEPVAHAHERGIIHRDIKPANLMIGELGEVHVMDWGLARDLTAPEVAGSRDAAAEAAIAPAAPSADLAGSTNYTDVAGTPYYMPPEQAEGRKSAMGPAGDVYALGAVLYEILCGKPPYASSSGPSEPGLVVLGRVLDEPPAPIETVARPDAPRELFPLCKKAMERSPGARFPSARALMEAVRDWLDGIDRRDRARKIVEDANRDHVARIGELRAEARDLRARSRQVLGALRAFDPAQKKAEGWKLADDADDLDQLAMREEIHWTQRLRSALNEAPDLAEAHAALAEHYASGLLASEEIHDAPSTARLAALLEEHASKVPDRDRRAHFDVILRGQGRLSLHTDPAGAQVVLRPYDGKGRYFMPKDEAARSLVTPVRELPIDRGSYLLVLSAPGRAEVRYPIAIGRGEHWDGVRPGDVAPRALRLPGADELGQNDIYVPEGWFVAGGDRRAGESLARQRVWVDGFVIRKHPVTNAEFIAFLDALVAEGRAEEARAHCPRLHPGAMRPGDDERAFPFDERSGRWSLRDLAEEASLPVVFVDWHAATAFAAHEAERSGLPWRLPSEFEWEKAARGVDGRFMPWGDHVEPTWACVSGSHPERKRIMPVHQYPTDVSPYGVRGTAGNVRDWCIERWTLDGPRVEGGVLRIDPAAASDPSYRPLRGGAWTSAGDLSRLCVRYADLPEQRHGVLGFRIARSIAA